MTVPFHGVARTKMTTRLAKARLQLAVTAIGGLILLLFLGSCRLWSATNSVSSPETEEAITEVLDAYMRAMAGKDIAQAYDLMSSRAKGVYSLSDVQQLVEGTDFALFEGYQSVAVGRVSVIRRVNTNPSAPTVSAQASGVITYAGGVEGTFEAGFDQENSQWRLSKVWIVVPPEKFYSVPEAMRDEWLAFIAGCLCHTGLSSGHQNVCSDVHVRRMLVARS